MVNKNILGLVLVFVFLLVVVGSLGSVAALSFDDFGLFSTSSFSGSYPNITNAYVEPVKVVPGDVMTVSAEVEDDFGVSSVTADMGGIETISLFLKTGTVYDGLWQNEWLVHDTEVKDYNTTISAVNVLGNSATKIVEWSDPVPNTWTVGSGGDDWAGNVSFGNRWK